MRLRCFGCGKSVSTEVSDETIVRACLFCPECIEAGRAVAAVQVEPQHQWEFYTNGSFCVKCGAAIGSGTPCRR